MLRWHSGDSTLACRCFLPPPCSGGSPDKHARDQCGIHCRVDRDLGPRLLQTAAACCERPCCQTMQVWHFWAHRSLRTAGSMPEGVALLVLAGSAPLSGSWLCVWVWLWLQLKSSRAIPSGPSAPKYVRQRAAAGKNIRAMRSHRRLDVGACSGWVTAAQASCLTSRRQVAAPPAAPQA